MKISTALYFALLVTSILTLSNIKSKAQYFEHMYWDGTTPHNIFYDGVYNRLNPTGYTATGVGGAVGPIAVCFVVTLPNSTPVVNVNLDIRENVNSYSYRSYGNGIAEYAGGYLIAGEVGEPAFAPGIVPGISDILVVDISLLGVINNIQRIDLGGLLNVAKGIIPSTIVANGYYIVGYTENGGGNGTDITVIKYDRVTPGVVWAQNYNFIFNGNIHNAKGTSITEDPVSGELIVAGYAEITASPAISKAVTMRLNPATGAVISSYFYNYALNKYEAFNSVKKSAQTDMYIFGGQTDMTPTLSKDMLGVKLYWPVGAAPTWVAGTIVDCPGNTAAGGNDICYDIVERRYNGGAKYNYYMVGDATRGFFGGQDAVTVKLANNFNVFGTYYYGSPFDDSFYAADMVNLGGFTDGLVNFGLTERIPSPAQAKEYMVKTYFNGVVCFVDSSEDFYDSYYMGEQLMSPTLTSSPTQVSIYGTPVNVIDNLICNQVQWPGGHNMKMNGIEEGENKSFSIYPTLLSASSPIFINLNIADEQNIDIKIVNTLGATVFEGNQTVLPGKNEFRLSQNTPLQTGVYWMSLKNDNCNYTQKLVVVNE